MKDSVVLVAPGISLQLVPLLVLTCHCTVGVGVPVADAVKVAVPPEHVVTFDGCVVITGEGLMVSVAGFVVADPQVLVNTALYW